MAFYTGQYGAPLGRFDPAPVLQAAQSQANMYLGLGKVLGGVASAYFDKKREDKQIDAIVQNPQILEFIYKGQTDDEGLPIMPSDIKEVRKDVKALYREMGGRKGIETLLRADAAEQRANEQAARMNTEFDQKTAIFKQQLAEKDAKLEVLEKSLFPTKERVEVPPSEKTRLWHETYAGRTLRDIGEEKKEPVLRTDPRTPEFRGDIEAFMQAGTMGPMAPTIPPAAATTYEDFLKESIGRQMEGAGIGAAAGIGMEKLEDIEVPYFAPTEQIEVSRSAPIEKRTQEAYLAAMAATGLGKEHLPAVMQIAQMKPSVREVGSHGISEYLLPNTFYNKRDAAQAYNETAKLAGLTPTEAGRKSFLDTARIVDPLEIRDDAMKEMKTFGLDKDFQRVKKLDEVTSLFEQARHNPAALPAAATGLARLFEPSGMLTDEDIGRYVQGNKTILRNVSRWMEEAIDKGTLPEEDIDDVLEVMNTLGDSAKGELTSNIPKVAQRVAERFDIPVDHVVKYSPLEGMMPKTPPAGTPIKTAMVNAAIEQPVDAWINTPDGRGRIISKDAKNGRVYVQLEGSDIQIAIVMETSDEKKRLKDSLNLPAVSTQTRSDPNLPPPPNAWDVF